MEFKSSDMNRRPNVKSEDMKFSVLRDLFDVGDMYIEELENSKALRKNVAKKGRKRKLAGESLRERDPW